MNIIVKSAKKYANLIYISIFLVVMAVGFDSVNVAKAKELVKDKTVLIVDVRTPQEFKAGHINGAVNIDYYDAKFMENIKKLSRSKSLLIYCRSGGRSAKASAKITPLKFKKVYNLTGGYNAWKSAK